MQLYGTEFENSPRAEHVLKNQHFLAQFVLVLRLQFDQYPRKRHSTVPQASRRGFPLVVRVQCA